MARRLSVLFVLFASAELNDAYEGVVLGAARHLRRRLEDAAVEVDLLDNEADELVAVLLHMNGFEAPRGDSKCGAAHGHAGCDPASSAPCCENGICVPSMECPTGHDHSHHTCNEDAWGTQSEQTVVCEQHCPTPWQCNDRASAPAVAVTPFDEDAASLKALNGDELHEARVMLRYRAHVIATALAAVTDKVPREQGGSRWTDPHPNHEAQTREIARLQMLAHETAAKLAHLSDAGLSVAERNAEAKADTAWLARIGGTDGSKLGVLLKKFAAEMVSAADLMKLERDTAGNGANVKTNIGPRYTLSPKAALFARNQTECSRPPIRFNRHFGSDYKCLYPEVTETQLSNWEPPVNCCGSGLGSDIHVMAEALCRGVGGGYRVINTEPWAWLDLSRGCDPAKLADPLQCYFALPDPPVCPSAPVAKYCGYSDDLNKMHHDLNKCARRRPCRDLVIEYIFGSGTTAIVKAEVSKMMKRLFGPSGRAPAGMTTVHVRWGDKAREMSDGLVDINIYIDAVKDILKEAGRAPDFAAPIYLSTEDPAAITAFRNVAPPQWRIYVDVMVDEMKSFRPSKGNNAVVALSRSRGAEGTDALASLIVAMESENYILTLTSNWSRLMNELRTIFVDRLCGGCTRMASLG